MLMKSSFGLADWFGLMFLNRIVQDYDMIKSITSSWSGTLLLKLFLSLIGVFGWCILFSPLPVQADLPCAEQIRKINQSQGLEKFKLIEQLGDSLSEKYPDTTIMFSRIAIADKEIEKYLMTKSAIMYNLGYAFYHLRKYDSTMVWLTQSLKIDEQEKNNAHIPKVLNLMGSIYMNQMNYPLALQFFQDALSKARLVEDKKRMGSALNHIGNVFRLYGDHESALAALLEAQKIYQEIGFEEGIAWSAFNISKYYNTLGNYETALEQSHLSLKIYDKMSKVDGIKSGVIMVLSVINTIFINQGNLDSALYYSFICLNESETSHTFTGVADALGSIGKIYFLQSRYPEAIRYLDRSLEIKNKINDNMGVCNTNIYLARCYLAQNKYSTVVEHLEISMKLAHFNNFRIYLQEIYKIYSDLFWQKKDYAQAYNYFKKSMILKDSINSINLNERISALKLRYGAEQKDKENTLLKKNNQIQKQTIRRQQIYGLAFFLMFLLLLGLIFVIQRSRKKQKEVNLQLVVKNDEIKLKQKEIEEINSALYTINLELEAKNDNLYQLATTDSLTGIYNRAYLFQNLQVEFNRASRHQMDLSCILFDIDFFKNLNDIHGHLFGDSVLKQIADIIKQNLRQEDVFGRYGGEEFIIMLPNTSLREGLSVAEKLRVGVESYDFNHNELIIKITISFGVASLQDNLTDSFDTLIRYADRALYSAKRSGRNKSVGYNSGEYHKQLSELS